MRQSRRSEHFLAEVIPYIHTIKPAFTEPEFIDLENIPQQIGCEDYGWWSFYNAFMIVTTGDSLYLNPK